MFIYIIIVIYEIKYVHVSFLMASKTYIQNSFRHSSKIHSVFKCQIHNKMTTYETRNKTKEEKRKNYSSTGLNGKRSSKPTLSLRSLL